MLADKLKWLTSNFRAEPVHHLPPLSLSFSCPQPLLKLSFNFCLLCYVSLYLSPLCVSFLASLLSSCLLLVSSIISHSQSFSVRLCLCLPYIFSSLVTYNLVLPLLLCFLFLCFILAFLDSQHKDQVRKCEINIIGMKATFPLIHWKIQRNVLNL